MQRFLLSVRAVAFATSLSACSYEVFLSDDSSFPPESDLRDAPGEADRPGAPEGTTVDGDGADDAPRDVTPSKQLLLAEPSIVQDDTYAFSAMMTRLAGGEAHAAAFTEAWLRTMAMTRPGAERLLLGPWRTLACPSGYGSSATPCALDLHDAPFQLLAIVNRIDLAPDACAPGGELRFVYTALDPVTRTPLDATFIFEFPVRDDAGRVAAAWRALGRLPFGTEYSREVRDLVGELLDGTDPTAAHLRSDELSFAPERDAVWELRDFTVQGGPGNRSLVQTALFDTPVATLDGTPTLAEWVRGSTRFAPLPTSMRGLTARTTTAAFGWTVPEAAEGARLAFSGNTCNGCHGGDRIVGGVRIAADRLPFQHVAPARSVGRYYGESEGSTRVSTYLDSGDGSADELGRRAEVLLELATTDCSTPPPSGPQYGLRRRDH